MPSDLTPEGPLVVDDDFRVMLVHTNGMRAQDPAVIASLQKRADHIGGALYAGQIFDQRRPAISAGLFVSSKEPVTAHWSRLSLRNKDNGNPAPTSFHSLFLSSRHHPSMPLSVGHYKALEAEHARILASIRQQQKTPTRQIGPVYTITGNITEQIAKEYGVVPQNIESPRGLARAWDKPFEYGRYAELKAILNDEPAPARPSDDDNKGDFPVHKAA
jgi:hypothetical protein